MGEIKMAGLTQLTLEAHHKLAREGKVEQVSEPLNATIRSHSLQYTITEIIEKACDYPIANRYMVGVSHQTDEENIVTPFVLYKVS